MKKNAKFESIFILTDFFTKLKIINAIGAGSLRLSRNDRTKTLTRASMWFWREEHNTRPTLIDYAPGIVILAGIVKIMPASFIQSDDRNLPMRYIKSPID